MRLLGVSGELLLKFAFVDDLFKKFFCEECEERSERRRKRWRQFDESEGEYDIIDAEDELLYASALKTVKSMIYAITQDERFQPFYDYPAIKDETFKLVEYKVATPEEMFNRKLEESEYSEALEIAKLYGLDCDIVYQKQWINCKVSVFAIREYLSKVSRKKWVINECLERVAENISSQRALIEYGLEITDTDAFIELFECQNNKCIDNENVNSSGSDNIHDIKNEINRETDIDMENLTFSSLNFNQKELLKCRLLLLRYLKRLKIYETILGDNVKKEYNSDFFYEFRRQSGLEAAVLFARDSNVKGVFAMLTYCSEETLQHWLAVVSNFPETLNPIVYRYLLPICSSVENKSTICEWRTEFSEEEDWCWKKFSIHFNSVLEPRDFEKEFYTENTDLLEYMEPVLTKSLVSSWFHRRSRQMEEYSSLVDHALKLVEIGIENHVPGLEKLYDDLETFEILVCRCLPLSVSLEIEFAVFEKMSDEEKIRYIMYAATEKSDNFVSRIQNHLIPFLRKCEKYYCNSSIFYELFSQYVTSIAKYDLTLCSKIFEKKDSSNVNIIIPDKGHLLLLAIDCIYACEQTDQLQSACDIIEQLPPREEDSSGKYKSLYDKIDLLDKHLGCADLLEEYNCPVTVKDVKDMQDDKSGEEIKRLITQITRFGARKTEPVFKEKEWFQMFNDLLEMREDCFQDCISLDEIYEIFVKTLLTSGRQENFGLASSYMQLVNDSGISRKKKLIPYKKSVEILVSAARDYVNSANSISDDAIGLAKSCLELINDYEKNTNELVKEEIDFVEALTMLYNDFEVQLLPIQIRLIEQPKLELVVNILNEDYKAFRKCDKLLKMCKLFNVCKGDDERVRNGKILTLAGDFAYKTSACRDCWNICRVIMNNDYSAGWCLCKKLALSDRFDNDEAKLEMLSFVVTYCEDETGEEIEDALDAIRQIKFRNKIVRQAVSKEKSFVDFGVNQVSKTAQQLSSWISSFSSSKK